MYTTTWCGYCFRLKSQLGRAGVEYDEVDIERQPDAADLVASLNDGNQTVPTLVFTDGSALTNPSAKQVQERLATPGRLMSSAPAGVRTVVFDIDGTLLDSATGILAGFQRALPAGGVVVPARSPSCASTSDRRCATS